MQPDQTTDPLPPGIEVTPEMVKAGEAAFWSMRLDIDEVDEIVTAVFLAMARVCPTRAKTASAARKETDHEQ